jgi:hypothetical protein
MNHVRTIALIALAATSFLIRHAGAETPEELSSWASAFMVDLAHSSPLALGLALMLCSACTLSRGKCQLSISIATRLHVLALRMAWQSQQSPVSASGRFRSLRKRPHRVRWQSLLSATNSLAQRSNIGL